LFKRLSSARFYPILLRLIIAAMRKLLVAVWSVATHRRPFVPRLPEI
jgi:hypothetical protein